MKHVLKFFVGFGFLAVPICLFWVILNGPIWVFGTFVVVAVAFVCYAIGDILLNN